MINIKHVVLETQTEEELIKRIGDIDPKGDSAMLVHIRLSYLNDDDWDEIIEPCGWTYCYGKGIEIEWVNDWWEGQACVRYIDLWCFEIERED